MKSTTIALVGNPNCGKTTLFNKLTGHQQKVGNWAGVTVERKEGVFTYQHHSIKVVDLPGVYSLTAASKHHALDEYIACQYILSHQADLVVNIIDGSNLKRNLYLTLQLLEMGVPCIIAVNMLDIAKQRNIDIDCKKLAEQLNCPVVPLVSIKNEGIEELKRIIIDFHPSTKPNSSLNNLYAPDIQQALQELTTLITTHLTTVSISPAILATKLLEGDTYVEELLASPSLINTARQYRHTLSQTLNEEVDILIADARYRWIQALITQVVISSTAKEDKITYWLDKIILNRILGIPIFLLMMYLMFEWSMNLGSIFQPLFDQGSTTLFVDGLANLGQQLHWPAWLIAVLANGVGLGINTVFTFIPQIGLLFLFLSFLEDSGYMARAAFVMDRFMQLVGLPGKSFIPLIVGFGCNVPAIMATRTLENPRDRLLTTLMSPFMSCGARLAIFVVFAGAFFPKHAGLILFLLYLSGIVLALITGFLLKLTLLKGHSTPFVLEIPAYHIPHLKTIFLMSWQRLKGFVWRAGKLIVPICVLVGVLNTLQLDGSLNPQSSQTSLLSYAGRAITPLLHPMGVEQDNWPATVGLISGTLAKEVVIGTLNTLYTQNNTQQALPVSSANSIKQDLRLAWQQAMQSAKSIFSSTMLNPLTANEPPYTISTSAIGSMQQLFPSKYAAFAYLLFVLLYIPCVSTIAAIAREVGTRWAYFSSGWSLLLAYSVAVIFYQASLIMLNPFSAIAWIIGILLTNCLTVSALYWFGLQPSKMNKSGGANPPTKEQAGA